MTQQIHGKDLIFISQINRDGSGTTPIGVEYLEMLQTNMFDIYRLSMSEGTFIAMNFNAFVVKLNDKHTSIS